MRWTARRRENFPLLQLGWGVSWLWMINKSIVLFWGWKFHCLKKSQIFNTFYIFKALESFPCANRSRKCWEHPEGRSVTWSSLQLTHSKSAAITRYHRMRGSNNRHLWSPASGGRRLNIKVLQSWFLVRPHPGLQMAPFSLCPHTHALSGRGLGEGGGRTRESEWALASPSLLKKTLFLSD